MNKYIKILVIIGIYVLLVSLLLLKNNNNNKKDNSEEKNSKTQYIIFENYLLLEKRDNKYYERQFDKGNYLKEKYNIFVDGKYFGNYFYRNMNSDIYLFNDNSESIGYNGNIIANNYNKNMKICNLKQVNLSSYDESIANDALIKFGINNQFSSDVMELMKYDCDIDNDNQTESIYELKSHTEINTAEFAIIFIVKNNKIDLIEKTDNNKYNLGINYILDIDGDDKLDLLILKTNSSTYCYQIYQRNKNSFKLVKDC